MKHIKRSMITGRPFRSRKQHTKEDKKRFIKYITEHPQLTNTQLAARLNVSPSYIWRLASEHDLHYFGKQPRRQRPNKKRTVEQVDSENEFFDDSKEAY